MPEKSIVTKTGDNGQTFLLGGQRVPKNHIRVRCYGEVDELNSLLGVAAALTEVSELHNIIDGLQNDLFEMGAVLATAPKGGEVGALPETPFFQELVAKLEQLVKRMEERLPRLQNFILPSGTQAAAFLHLGRTVCRRVERSVVELATVELVSPQVRIYLNRLSDLLFLMARFENQASGVTERVWTSQRS